MGGIRKAKKTQKPKEPEGLKHTVQICLYPTRAQACMLREHCREYIDCVNTIVLAHDAAMPGRSQTEVVVRTAQNISEKLGYGRKGYLFGQEPHG